jgi:hypothetical protein
VCAAYGAARLFTAVTVGGVPKGGGIYMDAADNSSGVVAELRLTDLKLNASLAEGKQICLHVSSTLPNATCASAAQLCQDGTGGPCMFSVFDPIGHVCCPTCSFPFPTHATMPAPALAPRLASPPPPSRPPPRMNCTCPPARGASGAP